MEVIKDEKVRIEKDGEIKEYDLLFSFSSEDKMKTYIAYTDHSTNDKGEMNIIVSSFNPLLGMDSVEELTEDEMEMVNDVINDIKSEFGGAI